ncbi:PadR family transcriptional regulator [Streptococcus sp. DTU_2020_1000888_1_SI_GRL_NUU_041A]|uniref:PadR family transcriptional regulator n=1 Tax=Streptococcus sp. DTU_2020_1000888_1_SI_GRL_NUU_041A TaxID=3077723 RepID=UPI0028E54AEB|nr:PadR family transcriptional regulator [Streptococcus sp. DTU_2020_1000888_1_SI_GRL_NUU_041A]WNU94172.1 PadR family transcriptional regulator [Streptococcus sp. DTU_2020_1000888_1_SI_GRL_NUU_041A]
MDKLILGLLMIKSFTVYEIRQVMRQNFSSMCSDSLGSIQAALKKLSQQGAVTSSEYVEKGKMKREYTITASGRILFLDWLKTPIDMSKSKNMELGKFLFMGYLPKKEQLEMLDLAIEGLEIELREFEAVKASIQFAEEQQQVQAYLEQHDHLATELLEVSQTANLTESISQLGYFEMKTLEFGLDSARFQLNWFTDLRKQLSEKDGEK